MPDNVTWFDVIVVIIVVLAVTALMSVLEMHIKEKIKARKDDRVYDVYINDEYFARLKTDDIRFIYNEIPFAGYKSCGYGKKEAYIQVGLWEGESIEHVLRHQKFKWIETTIDRSE